MQSGDVISERFELGAHLGTGAMGVVFRALDHANGADVAVKVLRDPDLRYQARLEREAEVLAGLHHPNIVRYIAHGTTSLDEAYLVMEWIDGEDLGRLLGRGRLPVDACVVLGARVASALAESHAHGVIHRDVKPSNLFLPGGNVSRVKVLDFGIARLSGVTRSTQTGAVLGTPGYLPPEQVRGENVLEPNADIFSLGCVLFECLTGAPAFAGQHLAAILAKILFEPVPRASTLCPEVPEALDDLISKMLAKEPGDRPSSAVVAAALGALERLAGEELGARAQSSRPPPSMVPSLTSDEQRVLSVVVIGAWEADASSAVDAVEPLRRVARARGARLEPMADGSMAAILLHALAPLDEAMEAARLALDLHAAVPGRPIVMATGRSGGLFKRTVGDAINRAVYLLDACTRGGVLPDAVLVDEASARLLEKSFDLRASRPGFAILGERDPGVTAFTLLGRASPFVGRKAELGVLTSLFSVCVEDSVAHATVVTGASGAGKSRFAHEFLRALKREAPTAVVWTAQAAALSAGAVLGLLAQALRGAAGLRWGGPIEMNRERLGAYVSARVPEAARARVTEFLGELASVRFPDDESPALWAARTDARLMREQMLRAWSDLVRAECAVRPVVLVLDDLQWADAPTIRTVSMALGSFKDLPFFVLGLARPEVSRTFPKLWEEQGALNLRLKELTRKAGAELVTHALGSQVTPSLIDRLLTQADGHVRYLEELVRAVAEGRAATSPETALALVGARLEQLPAEARRVLRAASVFGDVAWASGVAALVTDAGTGEVARRLDELVEREVLVYRAESRFPGEAEYAFRHALLREGAYAMLTDADRSLGHRLAAEWLQQRGESDPLALAEHFDRAGAPGQAAALYARGAELACSAGDSDSAILHAQRGLALEPPTETRGALLGVLCHAYLWRFECDAAASLLDEALRLARPGTVPWVHAVAARFALSVAQGSFEPIAADLQILLTTALDPEAVSLVALSVCSAVFVFDMVGQFEAARATLVQLDAIVAPVAARDPIARGWLDAAHANFAATACNDPWRGLVLARDVAARFQDADYPSGLPAARLLVAMSLARLGAFDEAERALRSAIVSSEPVDFALLRDYYLARSLLDQGAGAAAREGASTLIERARELKITRHEGRGHWLLAEIHARAADHAGAEREIQLALEQMPAVLVHRLFAQVTLASIRLAQGRADEALRLADEAQRSCAVRGISWLPARLVLAEALEATGAHERACAVLAEAHADLLADAEKIGAPALQRSFLKKIPEHARIVQLAVAWSLSPPVLTPAASSASEGSRALSSFPPSAEVQQS
jgi:eukaryotic-like serine/threonine-protein kinase